MAKQLDPWAALFTAALAVNVREPVGEGWLTAKAFSAKNKLSRVKSGKFLRAATKAGVVEVFRGTQISGRNSVNQFWYRPTAKKMPPSWNRVP